MNAQVYTWDNNGNLTNDGTSAYTYDQANRIKTLTQGTNNYAFAYNGVSDRVSQTVNSVLTRYALDPNAGLTQVLSDGTSTYLYGIGRIAQQQTNVQYFGADGLGSVRQIYNSSGQIIANHRYDPFGNTISQSGVGTSNYGFTGEWTDATGLEYLRARYYAPGQGRFFTRDTFSGNPEIPISLNLYNYAHDNPVILTDPSGHCIIGVDCPITIAIAIFVLVASLTSCGNLPPTALPPTATSTPPPTTVPQSTSPIPGALLVLQNVKAQCLAANPSCYNEDNWWWMDPLYGVDADKVARMEEQSLRAYRNQGLQLDQIVDRMQDNPLDVYLPPREYADVTVFIQKDLRSPVMGDFLGRLKLSRFNVANREPLFLLAHIVRSRDLLFASAQWCATSPNCLAVH